MTAHEPMRVPARSDGPSTGGAVDSERSRYSAGIHEYGAILWRRRWLLAAFVIGGTAAIAAWTLIMPQTFVASSLLMPPDEGEGVSASFSDLVSGGGGINPFNMGQNSSAEVFATILSSRTLADSLVARFELVDYYGLSEEMRPLVVDIVRGNLMVDVNDEGFINVSYPVKTESLPDARERRAAAVLSADIVNEAVRLLDDLNREKSVTRASRSAAFLASQVEEKRQELDSAQARMMRFQEANRAFALDQQLEASVAALADIQAKIQMLEVELAAARRELSPEAQEVRQLETQLSELRRQRANLSGRDVLGMNLQNVPELTRRFAELRLDLEVATQVYTFLQSQYHSEQVQAAKDLPTVSVLDPAEPPVLRASPRRTLLVAVGFAALCIVGVFGVFVAWAVGPDARRFWRETIRRRPVTPGNE